MSPAALKDALQQQEDREWPYHSLFENEEVCNKISKFGIIMTGNICASTKTEI